MCLEFYYAVKIKNAFMLIAQQQNGADKIFRLASIFYFETITSLGDTLLLTENGFGPRHGSFFGWRPFIMNSFPHSHQVSSANETFCLPQTFGHHANELTV